MDNFLLRFFSVQVLEKIVRLDRFLDASIPLVRKSDREVIGVFADHLENVRQQFYSLTALLGPLGADLAPTTHRSLLRSIATTFHSVDELHLHLAYIKGQWTCPETAVFVRALFESAARQTSSPQKISVVLSDTYMFEETDLSTYLAERASLPKPPRKTPTLFLPKVEVENPLQWAVLVHEMGHAMFTPITDLFSPAETNAITGGTEYGMMMLNSWVEEMYCDTIALHLLGPAYLASFVDFITLVGSEGFLEAATVTHPYPPMRIYVMYRNLQQRDVKASFGAPLFGKWDDLAEFFYGLFELRSQTERQHFKPALQEESSLPAVPHELRNRLEERVGRLLPSPAQPLTFDKRKFTNLSKRLQNGIPIGAYSPTGIDEGNEPAKAGLENMARLVGSSDGVDARKLEESLCIVRKRVREEPCTVAEIVNAGWLYKCEYIYAEAAKNLGDFNKDFEEEFKLKLLSLDNLLRNSIETSHLVSLLSTYSREEANR